jgi:xanthine dehydrogenase accessory factor
MNESFLMHAALSEWVLAAGSGGLGSDPQPLVLALVVGTQESTYQKPGALALVEAGSGHVFGLVSGGCLEGDLLARVRGIWSAWLKTCSAGRKGSRYSTMTEGNIIRRGTVLESNFLNEVSDQWFPVRYDTRSEADDFLGTALGCRGCVDIALIPLWTPRGKELSQMISAAWSAASPLGVDALMVHEGGQVVSLEFSSKVLPRADVNAETGRVEAERSGLPVLKFRSEDPLALSFIELPPACRPFTLPKRRRLLICGAGPDARPLIAGALELGLEVSVFDHRPAARDALQASLAGCARTQPRGPNLSPFLPSFHDLRELTDVDMHGLCGVLVMTHNLTKDAWCLDELARCGLNPNNVYLGLLGPTRRRSEVFQHTKARADHAEAAHPLDSPLLRSPMGLDLGGIGPAEIALEVLAELVRFIREPRSTESLP